jgi:hypothetical protein
MTIKQIAPTKPVTLGVLQTSSRFNSHKYYL